MSAKINVFLSSAGAINGLNVMKALRKSMKVRIIAGDCDPLAAGLHLADKGHIMPRADDPHFINRLIEICTEEKADIALPIYSADFPAFIEGRELIESAGISTYAPPKESWEICSNKWRVVEFLKSISVPCPKTWTVEQAINLAPQLPYPLFMKRYEGSGTKDVQMIRNRLDLEYFAGPEFIFQEYANGTEYTVDILSDLKGKMIAASPRKRLKIYGGLSVCGVTVKDPEIVEYCRKIVEELRLPGPSNIQCKRDRKGGLLFYDINPRFASGGLPLAVAAGLNSPELLVRMLMKWPLPETIEIKEKIYMVRFWDTCFLNERNGGHEICI